jgi:hypothetical protein
MGISFKVLSLIHTATWHENESYVYNGISNQGVARVHDFYGTHIFSIVKERDAITVRPMFKWQKTTDLLINIAQYLEDNNIYYIVKGLGGLDADSDFNTITVENS